VIGDNRGFDGIQWLAGIPVQAGWTRLAVTYMPVSTHPRPRLDYDWYRG
jgi:hypothetical protein